MLPGVYLAKKKNGTVYYRSSITYHNKHISLGSFDNELLASRAYLEAGMLFSDARISHLDYHTSNRVLTFIKWVILCNFRDNGMYIKTPIYMEDKSFRYYFSRHDYLIFDVDDLFYYSTHSIMRRGGHLFVSDYGMQVNILSRYGIKNFAVRGRDYEFVNGNHMDFRYDNIHITNRFHGVSQKQIQGKSIYETRIHINGDFIVGRYANEIEAAIAYNKAATILIKKGYIKNYLTNYIEEADSRVYKDIFKNVSISKRIRELPQKEEG